MNDFKTLSLRELERLAGHIQKEIKLRTDKRLASLRKEVEKLAAQAGLSLKDLRGDLPAKAQRRAKGKVGAEKKGQVSPKFSHPSNPQLIWSGRGRKPAWVVAWVQTGRSLESLEIAAQKAAPLPAPQSNATETPSG